MSQVDRLLSKTSSLSNLVDRLNATPVTLNTGKADAEINRALKSMNDFTRGVVNGTKQLANNEAALQEQIAALRQYSANLALGTKNGAERTNAIQAQVKAEQKLTLAGFERIEAEARLLAIGKQVNNESFKGVAELIKFESQVGKNTRSLELYAQVLKDTLGFVRIGSQDYLDLSAAIARVNTQLRQAQTLAQKPVATTQFAQPIGPQPLQLSRQVRTPLGVNAPQGRGIGQALIGGAFPLLFGGGPGSAIGGFVGELAGPLGGVVGSAVGMQFDALAEQAINLGKALDPLTADFDVLINRLGAVGTPLEGIIESYKELEEEGKALELSTKQLAELVGADGVKALQDFSKGTVKVQNAFSKLLTQMLALMAEAFNQLPGQFSENIERAVLLGQAEKSTDPVIQELVRQREASRSGSLGQKGFLGILRGGDPQEFARLTEEVIEKQREVNKLRFEELAILDEALKKEVDKADKIKEIEKERKRLAKEAQEVRAQEAQIAQARIQTQLNELANEQKIFEIRQQTANAELNLQNARYSAESSLLQLQESRMQRRLADLERLNTNFDEQRRLIDAIARNRVQQAKVERAVAVAQAQQGIRQAEIALQQIKFQAQRITLEIQLQKIKAKGEEDEAVRTQMLREINQIEKQNAQLVGVMVEEGVKRVRIAKEIAQEQTKIAENIFRGKVESIEAERVEARRAVNAKELAKATGQAADEAARLSRNSSRGSGSSGGRVAESSTTKLKIDPDVYEQVVGDGRTKKFSNIFELTEALDTAQGAKNARMERMEKMSASASSYASPSRYGAGSGARSGGGGTGSVNVTTGPVMEFDGNRYVSMSDFEKSLAQVASAQATSARSYGGRKYGGVG